MIAVAAGMEARPDRAVPSGTWIVRRLVGKASAADLRTRLSRGDRFKPQPVLSSDYDSSALASLSKTAHLSAFDAKAPGLAHHEYVGPLCGVHHRQHEGRYAITHFFQEVRMSDSESDRKSDLECLRLASELIGLATATLNPALKAQCLRMAEAWTDRVTPERDQQ